MNFKKNIKYLGSYLWKKELLFCAIFAATLLILFLTFGRIPGGSADVELSTAQSVSSIQEIYNNPVNAPYKIAAYAATKVSPSVVMLRAVSFSIFILACISLFYVLKHWHSRQAAILATMAFATNSIVLATARLGTPLIAVFSWFMFTAMLLWQVHSKSNKAVPIATLLGLGILLYTPGAIWFFIVMAVVYFTRFKKLFKDTKRKTILIGSILSFLLVIPLLLSFIKDTSTLKEWLLLPEHLNWGDIPGTVLRVPAAFLYRVPEAPLINVSRLPVFDLVGGMLFLIGLNAYRKKLALDRTKLMLGSALVGVVVGALGQTITAVILLLPFAFSVVAAGIEFLLDEWQSVFPRNPFARGFGSLLLTIVVLFSAYYHLTRVLVVWPQTPETKQIYTEPRIINESH